VAQAALESAHLLDWDLQGLLGLPFGDRHAQPLLADAQGFALQLPQPPGQLTKLTRRRAGQGCR